MSERENEAVCVAHIHMLCMYVNGMGERVSERVSERVGERVSV